MDQDVKNVIEKACTVKMLIESLQDLDPDAPVFFVSDYGDYHNTQQALPVSHAEEFMSGELKSSPYSQSGIALVEDTLGDDDDAHTIVVLDS